MRARLVLPALLAIVAPTVSGSVQQLNNNSAVDDTTMLLTAAAARIRSQLSRDSVLIDIKDGTAGAAVRARAVAKSVHAQAGKANRQCTGAATPNTCRLIGAVGVIEVMSPLVRGNTATVRVRVMQETSNADQPIYYSEHVVKLVRAGGKWIAISSRLKAVS